MHILVSDKISLIAYIDEQLLLNKHFDQRFCLDCDEMTVFCDEMNAYFSLVITFPEVHCIAEQLLLNNL